MQDLIFATYLIPPFAFIIVTIAGISAKSATSYAQHFRRRVLEQEIKSPHYVGFLHSELFQTAIKASLARETTNSAVFFYSNNQFACTACDAWTTKYVSKAIGLRLERMKLKES